LWPAGGRIGLAVSGGPDSVALLLLADAAFPGMVEAATVDHGLRPESADEAMLVARHCADLGVPHAVLPVQVAAGNLQDRARAARYAALGEWLEERGLEALLTAHQLDDQAETLLMRLNRGSGVRGLASIRGRTGIPGHPAPLLRPLLGWRRAELAAVVERAGLEAAVDPSNDDERFDRVRIRQELARADWILPEGLARSAQLLGQAADVIEHAVGREWTECVVTAGDGYRYAALRSGLAGVNLVRIGVVEAVARALGGALDPAGAAWLVENLIAGQPCNVGGIAGRAIDENGERLWQFAQENPRRG
jgi:tRNA(Ile)-lysidine synthase